MAYEFNGTNQYMRTPFAVLSGSPFTLSAFVNTRNATANQNISCIAREGPSGTLGDRIGLFLVAGKVRISITNSTGSSSVDSSGSIVANTWTHAAGRIDGTSARTYINGVGTSATVTQRTLTSLVATAIGSNHNGTNFVNFLNGFVCEVGIWNAALTDNEIASLADGMTCDKVRPQSLVFYAPLVRTLQDLKAGVTITNNNTATVANHPRVYA